ncbi:MAG: zinc ribbon domain-containing protein [Candidatus Helarchaeota archaeon]
MSSDREIMQNAINRAIKAANRALKAKAFDKVGDIYYRIAYMLNDLGNTEDAQKFSEAAKQYKEKNQLLTEIKNIMTVADEAIKKKDFMSVSENYLKVASLAEAFGDKATSEKFVLEAEKFLEMAKIQSQTRETNLTTMTEISSNIQATVPASIEIKPTRSAEIKKKSLGYDEALVALGLICPYCGFDIDPDFKVCPNCGKKL